MTNVKEIETFEAMIHNAVHDLFNNLPEHLDAMDLKDVLGIMQFEIFHIWTEAQDKIRLQNELDKKK
jgi:hypothetical protein